MLFPPALWPLRDEREACHSRTRRPARSTHHALLEARASTPWPCTARRRLVSSRLKRQLSRASVSQPAQPRSSPRPERARTARAQCRACPPHCRPSPDPTAVDPLSSSRLCSCKPRLVDTLQLPLRLTQRMCSDLSCAACQRPCSCCHPSPDPCRTRHPRLDSAPAVEVVLRLCDLWAPCSLRALQLKGPLTHARVLRVIDSACARGALGARSGDLQQRVQASMCHLLQKSRSKKGPWAKLRLGAAVATALGHSHAVGVGESAHELGNVHST